MTQFKQPYLPKTNFGLGSKITCPECGAKKSFRQYFDGNTNQPINPKVGICDRKIKCGYHYTPKQYFLDNPNFENQRHFTYNNQTPELKKPEPPPGTIPFSYVEKSASYQSNFVRFLCEFLTTEQISSIGDKYAIGATRNKEIIYWQIDIKGKVHTGKIMQYNPETGRRIKHENGSIDWVHNKLKHSGQLPENFNLQQCFFGEHLLKIYPDKMVAIVESEKTAVIASVYFHELVWMAAGNLNGLSVDKCKVLKGRKVILFPDLKAFNIWKNKATVIQQECDCQIEVSNLLERIASEQEKENGFDIADFLIRSIDSNQIVRDVSISQKYSPILQNMIDINPAVQSLIQSLDLVEVSS